MVANNGWNPQDEEENKRIVGFSKNADGEKWIEGKSFRIEEMEEGLFRLQFRQIRSDIWLYEDEVIDLFKVIASCDADGTIDEWMQNEEEEE